MNISVCGFGEANKSDLENFSILSKKFLPQGLMGKKINNESKLVLIATYRALCSSAISIKQKNSSKIAIIMHTSFGGLESYESFFSSIQKRALEPASFACSLPCVPSSVISLCWTIQGPCLTFVTPIFSEETVLNSASDLLCIDESDWVICGYWHLSTTSSAEWQKHTQSGLSDFAKVWITKSSTATKEFASLKETVQC